MVTYTFRLQVQGLKEEYRYAFNLTTSQENSPESVFTLEIRENIRNNLQKQSLCKINDFHLIQIIKTWIQDIKEGYRDSTITLDLPLMIAENISRLHEAGNQEIPAMINPDLSDIEPCLGMLPPLIFS